MSEQPPYGQQPYGQQAPGQQPYGQQGGYPMPYGATPPQKSNTTRNVLLVVGAVVLLFCGGLVAFVVWAFNATGDAIQDTLDDFDGEAITVTEGEAFTFGDLDFDAGWTLASDPTGGSEITGLRATNPDGGRTSRYVSIDVRLLDGTDILAEISCSSAGGIGEGQSKVLTCFSSDELPADYDSISVDDF